MIINLGSWFVPVGVNFVGYFLSYNTDTEKFTVLNTGDGSKAARNQASKLNLTVAERGGVLPNTQIASSCNGTTELNFFAQLNYPFAYVTEIQNSVTCGFIAPVPPPPPTPPSPPPVCDLTVSATSTSVQSRTENDGTVTATISTTVTGDFVMNLFNDLINPTEIIENVVVNAASPAYTFNNLPAGTYRVEVSSIDFNCTSQTTILVGAFAFNERFFFLFCEQRFALRQIRLSIKKAGFDGATTQIEVAGSEVAKIDYPSVDRENKFFTIMGSECTINLIANEVFDLEDIYTDTEGQYLLELSFEETGDLIWSGYIIPDSAREPFKSFPYLVSISATDGVKLLNDIDFDINDGRITFLQGLKYALDKTNVKLGFKTMIDIVDFTANANVLLTGLTTNIFGLTLTVDAGTYNFDSVTYTTIENSFTFDPITFKKTILIYAIGANVFAIESKNSVFPRPPRLPQGSILIATLNQNKSVLTIIRDPFFLDDTLANHTFDAKRFIKDDGTFTDCYTVIDYICKQFTAQIKQSNGFWVIENIGYKGRDVVTLESCFDNDLNTIYLNQEIDLSIDVSCDADGTVLGGGSLSIGSGHKKETVIQKIGFPVPVIPNFGFENWTDGTPDAWTLSQPLNYFNRGSKFDRIFNPSTGEVTLVETGGYYFNMLGTNFNSFNIPFNYITKKVTSSTVPVFNQEIITLTFQSIVNNPSFGLPIFTGIYFNLGNYRFVNFRNNDTVTPIWITDAKENDCFFIEIANDDLKPPIGDTTNVSIETLPAPIQAYLTIGFSEHFLSTKQLINGFAGRFSPRFEKVELGFDNFKISKKSPVNATIIGEDKAEVLNTNKFSTVPEPFEIFFTDVDNAFRTDGIKTLSGTATTAWKRKSIDEGETIVKIVARELLSQYQTSYKIFEGSILAENISIRAIFNLPTLDLFKFVPTSMNINLLKCTADVDIVQIYAEEGSNSGVIGGGGGAIGGGNVNDDGFVLGFKNFIFTDGNNNLIVTNGI